MFLQNNSIPFKEILSYSLSDNENVVQTAHTITTNNTGSVVGRGIVGGLIAGPVGAIIGGSTAKKSSTTTVDPVSIHKYTVFITIDNINNSLIKLPFGNNEDNARHIASLLEVIINKNNQMSYGKQ